jgi:hypothetical protein
MIGTLDGVRAFHTARGNPLLANASDADATAALVRGSDYVRRAYQLIVGDDDQRVIDAAYVSAGYEISASGLAAMPGFWSKLETGTVLTKVDTIGFSLTNGAKTSDAMSPSETVRCILRGAFKLQVGFMVV